MRTCKITDCNNPHSGKGFCRMHYKRWYKHGDPHKVMRPKPLRERFEDKIFPVAESGCWIWMGSVMKHSPHGQFWNGERVMLAHRYSWEIHNGPIPNGLFVLHKCDTPSCVNPHHLFLGTQKDNLQDARKKGRMRRSIFKGEERQIKDLYEYGFNIYKIADMFGVTTYPICYHLQGRTGRLKQREKEG